MKLSLKRSRVIFSMVIFITGIFASIHGTVHASATLGTIDPRNVGNFKAILENTSLAVSAPGITFGKFTTESAKNITVSNTELRGFGWGEGIGWFVTNCADTTSGCTGANSNFKIANDGTGKLSGYAWGENTGWINFGPFLNPLVSTVKITNGLFGGTLGSAGYAWAQNFGWIKFDCSDPASCVETDWRATSAGGGGSSGGGGGNTCPYGSMRDTATGQCVVAPICPNTTDYSSVPILTSGGSVTTTLSGANKLGFAIQTFDAIDPAHSAGDFATENALNANSGDQVVVYEPFANNYVLGFEDLTRGDFDYNDLVVGIGLACTPSAGSPCPAPSTLGDTTVEVVRTSPSGEKTLQAILDSAGYTLDKTADQKQYQTWNIPKATTVTITAKEVAKYAGHSFVFGYYTGNSLDTFVPIFRTANVGAQSKTTVPNACNQSHCSNSQVRNVLGQCVDVIPDFCPNIAGNQTTFPPGYQYDADGNCVPVAPDACPNVDGYQPQIPDGMQYNEVGNCVVIPTDACGTNPALCTPPPDACTVDPASCTPIRDVCAANPSACVPPPTKGCDTNPALCNQTPVDPCTTDPSRCAPPSNLCTTYPELCTPSPSFCTLHPDLCVSSPTDKTPGDIQKLLSAFSDRMRGLLTTGGSISSLTYNALLDSALKLITAFGIILPIVSMGVSYAVGNPMTWADIPLLFGRVWNSFLIALGWKRRRKPWGVVYDSVTKRPIDPAYVVLSDLQGNEIATAITDINGRYGFAVDPGTYKILVNKSNYAFPSTKLAGKTSDNLYEDLYFGEDITITREGEIIMKNIPIDQLAFDWNEYAKAQHNTHGQKLHFYRKIDVLLYHLSQILFWAGFAFAIYAIIVSPSVWNAVILALYILLTIIRAMTPLLRAKGWVHSRGNGEPLPYSIVRLISTSTNTETAHKVADRIGNYYGLVQNGTYGIVVDTKHDEQAYDKHFVTNPVVVKKGYLKEKFKI